MSDQNQDKVKFISGSNIVSQAYEGSTKELIPGTIYFDKATKQILVGTEFNNYSYFKTEDTSVIEGKKYYIYNSNSNSFSLAESIDSNNFPGNYYEKEKFYRTYSDLYQTIFQAEADSQLNSNANTLIITARVNESCAAFYNASAPCYLRVKFTQDMNNIKRFKIRTATDARGNFWIYNFNGINGQPGPSNQQIKDSNNNVLNVLFDDHFFKAGTEVDFVVQKDGKNSPAKMYQVGAYQVNANVNRGTQNYLAYYSSDDTIDKSDIYYINRSLNNIDANSLSSEIRFFDNYNNKYLVIRPKSNFTSTFVESGLQHNIGIYGCNSSLFGDSGSNDSGLYFSHNVFINQKLIINSGAAISDTRAPALLVRGQGVFGNSILAKSDTKAYHTIEIQDIGNSDVDEPSAGGSGFYLRDGGNIIASNPSNLLSRWWYGGKATDATGQTTGSRSVYLDLGIVNGELDNNICTSDYRRKTYGFLRLGGYYHTNKKYYPTFAVNGYTGSISAGKIITDDTVSNSPQTYYNLKTTDFCGRDDNGNASDATIGLALTANDHNAYFRLRKLTGQKHSVRNSADLSFLIQHGGKISSSSNTLRNIDFGIRDNEQNRWLTHWIATQSNQPAVDFANTKKIYLTPASDNSEQVAINIRRLDNARYGSGFLLSKGTVAGEDPDSDSDGNLIGSLSIAHSLLDNNPPYNQGVTKTASNGDYHVARLALGHIWSATSGANAWSSDWAEDYNGEILLGKENSGATITMFGKTSSIYLGTGSTSMSNLINGNRIALIGANSSPRIHIANMTGTAGGYYLNSADVSTETGIIGRLFYSNNNNTAYLDLGNSSTYKGQIRIFSAEHGSLYIKAFDTDDKSEDSNILYLSLRKLSSFYGGKPYLRVSGGFAVNGTAKFNGSVLNASGTQQFSSDRRVKHNIESVPEAYEHFYDFLKPCSYIFNNNQEGRKHFGFIAQEVEEAYSHASLDENKDNIIDKYYDEDKKTTYYALSYNDFIALNTWQIQKAKGRIEELEAETSKLEEEIEQLKKLLLGVINK